MALDIWITMYRNLYKNCSFLWRSSNYRPLKSVLHVRPGWIIYQNMRETWEKKVMKFECEIPIGLDARRKKRQGGGLKKPPPMGLGLSSFCIAPVSVPIVKLGKQRVNLSVEFWFWNTPHGSHGPNQHCEHGRTCRPSHGGLSMFVWGMTQCLIPPLTIDNPLCLCRWLWVGCMHEMLTLSAMWGTPQNMGRNNHRRQKSI